MNVKNNISKFLALSLALILILLPTSTIKASDLAEDLKEGANQKVVYLTFDDGPGGDTTISVLDTLKKHNVPATFFVIGSQIKGQEETILRMKNEGHSIGLHSYSHNRNKLYNGNEGFLNEMLKDQQTLYEVTGEKYTILRFPFGCNNSTYRLNESLVSLLHKNNLKIYDWTTDSEDGAHPKANPSTILRKACDCKDDDTVTVLMHCSYVNANSAKALPGIIKFYKQKGYTFKAIDKNTPEVYKVTRK